MLTPANNWRVIRQDIEKNLDLWEEVDRVVGAPKRRPSTERGDITPAVSLALLVVLITHLIGVWYFINFRCPNFQ